ncbi:MAG: hypothetical protein HY044_02820 [Candidatus Woesebacteria bacterium]|nr:MAG: hypothetical protein HY044_02820 [Candidatus Woesebacteria bacterium]
MEELNLKCPTCHVDVRQTDFFCYNCGKKLKSKPLSTSITTQALIYLGSFLLPPMGIIWGIKYLRQENSQSKIVGMIAILLTIISLILTIIFTINFVNSLNSQINSQLQNFGGL